MCLINYQIDHITEELLLTTTTSITTFKITNVERIFSSNFEGSRSDVINPYLYSTESVEQVLSIKESQIEKSNIYPNKNNTILKQKYGRLINIY